MIIKRIQTTDIPNWFIAIGKYKGRLVAGYGITFFKALQDALR